MSRILSIDPGPRESAWVILVGGVPTEWAMRENAIVKALIDPFVKQGDLALAIEDFVPYGQRLTWDSLATVKWIGRFDPYETATLISRPEIREHLCGKKSGVGNPDIRQALIRRFGPTKREAIGLKASPGPLYGFKSHLWAALAVGVTAYDRMQKEEA